MICDKGRLAEYDYKLYHRATKRPKPAICPPDLLPKGFSKVSQRLQKASRRVKG